MSDKWTPEQLDALRYGGVVTEMSDDVWLEVVDASSIRALAQSYLDRDPEEWTWCDPEDVKRLARAVLNRNDWEMP